MSAKHRLKPLAAGLLLAWFGGTAAAADLMDAFQLARISDPQLQIAEFNRLAVGENVPQARAALLPNISAEAGLTDSNSSSSQIGTIPSEDGEVTFGQVSGESDIRSRSYGLNLQQSIYSRANYTRLHAAKARSLRAAAEYDLAADQLMLRVSEAYFNVLTAIDTLAFARAERRAVKRQLDQAEQRFEVGLTAITDVHEARARYDSARAAVIAADNTLSDAREALAEITGKYLERVKGLGDGFLPTLPTPASAEAWVKIAIENNPNLQAGEFALLAAGHDVATARAARLPTLGGFVNYGESASWGTSGSNNVVFPADSDGDQTVIGLSLNVPIFTGGLIRSQVRQAIFTRDLVDEQLDQQRRAVTRSTRNAYRAITAGISEISAREQALISARSALEATEAGFEVGTRTIVDVLLSQQQLFQAQRDYSQARHNFLLNTLRLEQAAGTIEVKDLQEVNRLLVADAEAKLDAEEEQDEATDAELTPPAAG